jgi:hypothetical protein
VIARDPEGWDELTIPQQRAAIDEEATRWYTMRQFIEDNFEIRP